MAEINLLKKYPRTKRNVTVRNVQRSAKNIEIAKQYGREYFDAGRETGYGGYRYDGRWLPVAETIVEHFGLQPGDRVLDIGCAKGFLIKDLVAVCPRLEVFGVDLSLYAISQCVTEVAGRVVVGNAKDLPFPDGGFDVALAINVIHNLERAECINALREIERVASRSYVQVDSWFNEDQKALFLNWMLTAQTYFSPAGWKELFSEAGYAGDFYWTITE